MKNRYVLIFLSLLLTATISCNRSAQKDQSQNFRQNLEASRQPLAVAAGHCRVEATVLSIMDKMAEAENNSLCSKAPCQAIVQIDSIHGYGSGFQKPLSVNRKMAFTFTLTLGNTKMLGIKTDSPLPGLKSGDRFRADVEERQQFGGSVQYMVHKYEKVSK